MPTFGSLPVNEYEPVAWVFASCFVRKQRPRSRIWIDEQLTMRSSIF
jgi:hypothetical protein